MYEFVDSRDSGFINRRPAEAMQINGAYLEDSVRGYRTLAVSGRELLVGEAEIWVRGVASGGRLVKRSLPPRPLAVTYQIVAESNSAFREAFNQLNRALMVEEAKLIFEDEQDKYFIGTPSSAGEMPKGTNRIVSEFGIVCARPWKFGEMVTERLRFENPGSCESSCVIRVVFRTETRDYRIRHIEQSREIRVIWSFDAGDMLEIDTGRRLVTINGHERMTALDFRQPMFSIRPGENSLETSVPNNWTEIMYQSRWI